MIEEDRVPGLSLLCRVGSRICALPIRHVSETMRPLPINALNGFPDFVLGLSIVRGAPIPVIDAGRLLGGPGERRSPTRFVAIKAGGRPAVLAVDEVVGVRNIESEVLADLPPLLGDGTADVVAAIGALDAELLVVLRGTRIVSESVWNAIDAGSVSL